MNKWTTFSCSHFFILSCVRNSFMTSSYTKKNIHGKQKAANSPQGKTTLQNVCNLHFMVYARKNISVSRTLYFLGYDTNETTLLCDHSNLNSSSRSLGMWPIQYKFTIHKGFSNKFLPHWAFHTLVALFAV